MQTQLKARPEIYSEVFMQFHGEYADIFDYLLRRKPLFDKENRQVEILGNKSMRVAVMPILVGDIDQVIGEFNSFLEQTRLYTGQIHKLALSLCAAHAAYSSVCQFKKNQGWHNIEILECFSKTVDVFYGVVEADLQALNFPKTETLDKYLLSLPGVEES